MQPDEQKRKKREALLARAWEGIVLSIATALFLIVLVALVFKIFFLSESIVVSTLDCIDSKIRQEQMGYHGDALKVLLEIERDVRLVDGHIETLQQKKEFSTEGKKELNMNLKKLEESSILLKRNFDEYFDDTSIQAYPRSSEEITTFVYETKNFSIALDRFVRTLEMSLFLTEEYSEDQVVLIMENYYDVIWYLDQFGLIEGGRD